jgi:hypothetical protein
VQILGLTPDSNLVLRTNLGAVEAIPPSTWRREWLKWVPQDWMLDSYPTPGDTPKPDPDTCYATWHAYATALPVCPLDNIRGLGVHLEGDTPADGTIVWNTGRGLVVSPTDAPTYTADAATYRGDYRYTEETHRTTNLPAGTQPLADAQGLHLLQLLRVPGLWGSPNDHLLLFGWGVLAPMGEALPRRPQLAITGGTSKGKTWTRDNVLRPMVGGRNACHTSNAPTEPGLRALMATNTLPHLVDEQEAAKYNEPMERLQRTAYDGGMHLLGGQGGGPGQQQYVCAALCTLGINQATDNPANENRRVTVSRKTLPPAQFLPVAQAIADAYTVPTGQALVLRTFNNLRNTLANVPAFAAALVPHYGSEAAQRRLDNHALCLAFAHSATATTALDAATATTWLQQQGWDFATFAADSDAQQQEGTTLLRTLLATRVTLPLYLPGQEHPHSQTRTLRALLALAQHTEPPSLGGDSGNGSNALLARQHLADTWGLYLLGGKHDGHLLWATGTRGDTRQEHLAKHHSGYKWGKGSDAVARLLDLGLDRLQTRVLEHLYPNEPNPIRGVAIPLTLLDGAPDVTQTQEPCDAPCDGPEPPPW